MSNLTALGYAWTNMGGNVFCWYKKDLKKKVYFYVGDNGVDVMALDGTLLETRYFSTLDESVAFAEAY